MAQAAVPRHQHTSCGREAATSPMGRCRTTQSRSVTFPPRLTPQDTLGPGLFRRERFTPLARHAFSYGTLSSNLEPPTPWHAPDPQVTLPNTRVRAHTCTRTRDPNPSWLTPGRKKNKLLIFNLALSPFSGGLIETMHMPQNHPCFPGVIQWCSVCLRS